MTLEVFLKDVGGGVAHGGLAGMGVALIAGVVASAVCPCTLPVGLGMASVAGASESQSRKAGFLFAMAFFAGIVTNLAFLGALAGRLGAVLTESFGRYWTFTMALISLLATSVAFYGPRLKVDQLIALRRPGAAGSFAYGFIFSLGTSAAPLLLLLTVAAAQGKPELGLALAFAFGVGRGLPFLLVGLFAGALIHVARISSIRLYLQVVSGVALLVVSGYYARAFVDLL